MSTKSLLKLLTDMNKKEPYLERLKKRTLDLVSSYQPLFPAMNAPTIKVGTRTFYGEDRKTVYLLFKFKKRILVYGGEYLFHRLDSKETEPDHLYALRGVMTDDTFRDVLIEDDEEYLHEMFDLIEKAKEEDGETFMHRNTAWLLNMVKN